MHNYIYIQKWVKIAIKWGIVHCSESAECLQNHSLGCRQGDARGNCQTGGTLKKHVPAATPQMQTGHFVLGTGTCANLPATRPSSRDWAILGSWI